MESVTVRVQNAVTTALVGIVLLVSSINTASAENRSFKVALEECFWGLILSDESQRGLSLGLNVVSGALGSYAYTSATMSPDTFCAEKTAKTAAFVNESYQRLVEDVTRGRGEFLKTAMELTGCNAGAASAVAYDLRQGLASDLAHANYSSMQQAEKAVRLYTNLNMSAQANCTV